MLNFDDVVKENIKEHNPNWSQILDNLRKILIIGDSRSNPLFNLINQQTDIDKIYLYAKDPHEADTYFFLGKKRKSTDLKHFNDSKTFIEYSNDMDNVYKNIEDYNSNKNHKILIVFDDMIDDILSNKKLNPIVTELFIRDRKLSISLVLNKLSYFAVSKNIRLNSTPYFLM